MTQHLKPRSAEKVLYQGDDMARLAELKRAIDVAKRQATADTARIGDDTEAGVTLAQRAFDEFVDEAAERALTVVIQSIGRRRFTRLVAEHPPREIDSEPDAEGKTEKIEHPEDAGYGVNTETFPAALLRFADGDFVTIAEPKFSGETERETFLEDELAEGDYEELWAAAYMLNRGPTADPKSLRSAVSTSVSSSTDVT